MVCQSCHRHGPTRNTWFIQNIGVVVAWFHKTVRGELCRTCIDKYFWEYTLISFFFGWWGIISFFVTCVTIPVNIINYLTSLSLPAIPLGAGAPALAGASLAPWQAGPPPGQPGWPSPPPPSGYGPPAGGGSGYPPPPPTPGGATYGAAWGPAGPATVPRGSSTLIFALGIIGIVWSVLWLAVAIGMMVAPGPPSMDPKAMDDTTAGVTVLIFTLVVFATPSGLMFYFGRRGRRRAAALERIASLAATHSHLPLAQIAQELGTTPEHARTLILFGVGRGFLAGRLDAAEGAFLSSTAAPGVQHVAQRCPSCGGESTVVRAPGVAATCRYCGMALP